MIHNIRLSLAGRFPALASRDFALFWLGHLLSLIGTSMQNTAQPLLAYRISGRPFDLGLIGFALTLPTFFLAFPSGVLIERWDKRKTVIVLQIVMMADTLILAGLTLAGRIQIWQIAILSLVLGIAITFEITARQSMLIELVGREDLPNAIALQSTAFNISRVLGPALTAPLLLILPANNGEGCIFLMNALSFGAIILGLSFVKLRHKVEPTRSNQSITQDFLDGGRYIASNRRIAAIILLAAILGLFGMPVMQQIPVLAKDVLAQMGDTKSIVDARNSALYGAMGVGALVAAITLALNNQPQGRGGRLILGEAAFVAGLLGIAFADRLWTAILLVVLMGWGGVTQFATMTTLLQTQVSDEVRGRVFSIYLWSFQGIAPFGSLLIGWMTQRFSLQSTAFLCGMACLLCLGGIQAFYPAVRRSAA
jgi:MFS family permease